MTDSEKQALWDDFLAKWPASSVHSMALEEYTNDNCSDAFVYWLESRLDELGSIWGGSAFKFGIYRRRSSEAKEGTKGRCFGDRYGWYGKYGKTPQEAWESVKALIVAIVDAAQAGDLAKVEKIDFSPAVKWKIAFLYQPKDKPVIFPVYLRDALYHSYALRVSSAGMKSNVPYETMYRALSDELAGMSVFDRAAEVWSAWESSKTTGQRFWLVPLTDALGFADEDSRNEFCETQTVVWDDVPEALRNDMLNHEISADDRIALWRDGKVMARGVVGTAEREEISWEQESCEIVPHLESTPQYEICEVKSIPQAIEIWGPVLTKVELPIGFRWHGDQAKKAEGAAGVPQNIILYGPPGTGKTWSTVRRAVELCGVDVIGDAYPKEPFDKLVEEGRIQFVTFHQSYDYEQFVEGIRPVLVSEMEKDQADKPLADGGIRDVAYDIIPGVFRRIAEAAKAPVVKQPSSGYDFDAKKISFWKMSLGNTMNQTGTDIYEYCIENNRILLGYGLGLDFSGCDTRAKVYEELKKADPGMKSTDYNVTSVNQFKNQMKKGDIVIVSEGLYKIRAIGKVTGDYTQAKPGEEYGQARPVEWLVVFKESLPRERLFEKAISQMTLYQIYANNLKIDNLRELISPQMSTRSPASHVLIIDEINRGNMSKIFGELITLLEPSKRLGQEDEQTVTLPYSQERFGVPPNLHVIGTMNTADRSIALMDAALRRRFTFEELMPDSGVVKAALEKAKLETAAKGVQLEDEFLIEFVPAMLDAMNRRIEFLYDRDHTLGHSYFMKATSWVKLRDIMLNRIIPLLQEYFYNDWEKICAVLGCPYDSMGKAIRRNADVLKNGNAYRHPLVTAERETEQRVLLCDLEDYEDQCAFNINAQFAKTPDSDDLKRFLLPVAGDGFLDKMPVKSNGESETGGGNGATVGDEGHDV